ncbi:MAG: tRNA1(Val) (adenine(37)-N6)-methyltransferase [Lachnospiraceae bacterium]|jgi:tRNA1Val (adenine37-N6)-methyltransferase|nr:tRNA1(Val) (adenine(37)-N6)-methyltransferase [Lachnospiraceae bacterium]MCI8958471.1 tRNA1(Val) (adenine(37)-N6)-methyltransferase [Lachnospiraceae bacterium]
MSRIESRREAGGGCPGGEQPGETGGVRAGSGQPEETGGGAGGKQPEKAGGVSPGLVRADERVDDLQRNGYRIIQKRDGFCFGMDAVLLSGFARARRGERVLDLGTGTGIIPILLEAKTKGEHFTGLEIQEQVADMAQRSVKLNGLGQRVSIVQGDIKEASRIFGRASFDVVTSNPPYMNDRHGLKNPELPKAIARHEVLCCLEDVVREAAAVLKPGGRFYLVHRPRRLAEIMAVFQRYRLEPKRMKMVHPYADREANMVLLEAVRGGGAMMKVEAPVIVFREPGVYSEEIVTTYGY